MIARIIKRSMSQNTVNRIINNAETAEKRLAELRSKVSKPKSKQVVIFID